VKRAMILAVAALVSFGATLLYLQKQRRPEPPPVSEPSAPAREAPPAAREPQPTPAARVATGFRDAPKVSGTPVEVAKPQAPSAPDEAVVERRQLAEYAGGISNVAPVSPEQQRAILQAKLRHKKTYELVLRDAGLERESLSPAERDYAHQTIARALNDYKEGYLQDVRPVLSDEQFTLLNNYENTEFQLELERLQITINSK
jgi:hypothetical protein